MTKSAAQVLGVLSAALLAIGWFAVTRVRSRCPGSVFFEFSPPLTKPGPYQFELSSEDGQRCRFKVRLPVNKNLDKAECPLPLQLHTQGRVSASSITGLTLAGSPGRIALKINRGAELLYRSVLEPHYTALLERNRLDDPFCGRRALVKPECIRGSSQCVPFVAVCDGPEDCPGSAVCCASPEAGYQYGAGAATACTPATRCLERFAHIACHADSDCPNDMGCAGASLSNDFAPPLHVCRKGY